MMNAQLNDVTICAVDCVTTTLAARALTLSTIACSFGGAILFSDQALTNANFRCVRIATLGSRAEYSHFILKQLPQFIETAFALIVQWDGYVLEPRVWDADFLNYDLIGAVWPWHMDGMNVGNGGFTLRSSRLLRVASTLPYRPEINEDELICRVHRTELERQFGIRFAPEHIARKFSYERELPSLPSFGFHGLFNLWRHVDDDEVVRMSAEMPLHIVRSVEFLELLAQYLKLRKFRPLRGLFSRWRELCSLEEIRSQLSKAMRTSADADYFIEVCSCPGVGDQAR
jgi:Protein of unknown function (DUF5672)